MCGIAGFLDLRQQTSHESLEAIAKSMADTLIHRGPDDEGVWADASAGIALANRRLAIVDLSPAGHLPMMSPNGRFVVAYNGELYNHQELRRELARCGRDGPYHGHSDTEVMLSCFE